MKRAFFLFFISFACYAVQAQDTFMYRLQLKDKGSPSFSVNEPEKFLSEKSIERRNRQGFKIDHLDLPIDPAYFEAITETGASIRTYSKWVNTIVVDISNLDILPSLQKLPFVDSLYCVWKGSMPKVDKAGDPDENIFNKRKLRNNINSYGSAFTQISLNNGHLLHDAGYRGSGMSIAIMDGGFINADILDYFEKEKIVEVKSFNHEVTDPLRSGSDHGTKVLSCMLANKTGEMIGTAPQSEYYLFRTEVSENEFPVEEDYWIAALEYADSIGVDIISTSLGYNSFDDSEMNHSLSQLDGKSVPMSKAAGLAASRGMLLFLSAGNEGAKDWAKIMIPADADNVITVGSVMNDSARSYFSSQGPTADNRVKPDAMSMGTQTTLIASDGRIVLANGTSYATPVLAGLGACLWEALPDLTSYEMIELIRKSGNKFLNPDPLMGYGITDIYKAYVNGGEALDISKPDNNIYISFNPRENQLYINIAALAFTHSQLNIYSGIGTQVLSVSNLSNSIDISLLPKGVYIARLQLDDKPIVRKFIKM